jgi:transposase
MEATGAYHLPMLLCLHGTGIFVSAINPLSMKRYAGATLRKGKTDKMDAVKIANFGIDNWFKLEKHQPQSEIYEELKFLGRQYAHYITVKVASKLALCSILDRTMPGIKSLLKSSNPEKPTKDKLGDFVAEYQHFDNIVAMSVEEFVIDYCRWAREKGYHRSRAKAKTIYLMACEGIPTLPSSAPSTKMLTLEAVRILAETNRTLQTILSQMQALAITLPEYSVIRSMHGVGDVLAPRLIAEIGDVLRFHSASALIAYAGIDSPPFQSGAFTGTKRNISKRGSSLLRKTGYEVMKCLKTVKPTHDSAVYDFMCKKEAEGKPKKVAKIAALNKFLRIYYARVKEVYRA